MAQLFITTSRRSLTEADFCTWVGQARPGDILEYHRGFLVLDAELGHLPPDDRKTLRLLRRRALWASYAGLVHLVQRRIGPGDFNYLAVRRARPREVRAAASGPERVAAVLEPELEDAA